MSDQAVRTAAPALLSAAIAFAVGQVNADPIEVTTSFSTEYTDNVQQTSDGDDDIIYMATVGASYRNQEGMFDNTFDGLLGFETYQNGTYGNDLTVDLGWRGLIHLIPSRLVWTINENLKDTRQSSTRPYTPDNRERVNFFSTGPSYSLPITDVDRIQLTANYARTDYEESSQIDTYRYLGSVGWHHLMPSLVTVSASGAVEQVHFDNDVELLKESASFGLRKKHEFLEWYVEGGYAQTDAEQMGSDTTYDGFEGEASIRYQVSTDGQLSLFASHQLTDTSSQFSVLIFDIPFTFNVQQVVKLTVYEVGYDQLISTRDQLSISAARRLQEFQGTGDEEEIDGFSVRWSHQFSSLITGYLQGSYEHRRYSEFDRKDNEGEISLGLQANLYRNLQLNSFVALRKQNSDESLYDYDEMRVGVSVIYYPTFE